MSRAARVLVLLAAALAGCASAPKPEGGAAQKGGYYKDDGPGVNVPANLASMPDATPRAEPLHRYANRPYQVFGKSYVPFTAPRAYRERGVASWYGRRFHGQRTSSGETYDMYTMSAAHPLLPIPSYARVTNLANGRSVVVRINDRGPFHGARAIDLSYAAALKLGYVEAGSAQVDIESIVAGGAPADATPEQAAVIAVAPATAAPAAEKGVYLQLGAFASRDNAESFRLRVYRELAWLTDAIHVVSIDRLYKVHLGPYRTQADAKPVALRIGTELDFTPVMLVR